MTTKLKTIADVDDAAEAFEVAEAAFLRLHGWRHTCMNPASLWLWEKALVDGRTLLVDRVTAIAFVRAGGSHD